MVQDLPGWKTPRPYSKKCISVVCLNSKVEKMKIDDREAVYNDTLKYILAFTDFKFSSLDDKVVWAKELLLNIPSTQDMVESWLVECIGREQAYDKTERIYRFFEEACELA